MTPGPCVWGVGEGGRNPSHGGLDWPQALECPLGWGFLAPFRGVCGSAWHSRKNLGRVWTPGFFDPSQKSLISWGN